LKYGTTIPIPYLTVQSCFNLKILGVPICTEISVSVAGERPSLFFSKQNKTKQTQTHKHTNKNKQLTTTEFTSVWNSKPLLLNSIQYKTLQNENENDATPKAAAATTTTTTHGASMSTPELPRKTTTKTSFNPADDLFGGTLIDRVPVVVRCHHRRRRRC